MQSFMDSKCAAGLTNTEEWLFHDTKVKVFKIEHFCSSFMKSDMESMAISTKLRQRS